jgi:MFS family permease
MNTDNQYLREQILALVEKGLGRMNIVNVLGFIAGLIVGPGFIALGIALQKGWLPAEPGFFLLAWFVGGICSIVLIVLIVQIFRKAALNKLLLKELSTERETLIWVYIEYRRGQTSGVPFKGTITTKAYYHFYFLFSNGKQNKAWLGKDDAYTLFKLLGTCYPRISLGWDQARYDQWKNNPASITAQPRQVGDMKPYLFRNRV